MADTNTKYYHSKVKVEDILFPKIYGYDLKIYRPIIHKFNSSKLTQEKEKIAEQLPSELFCNCRFCGRKVITPTAKIAIYKSGAINLAKPSVKYRIIEGKRYELSCCENCLIDHFKDNPPKSPKYYYMKANRFGAYSFGYGYDEYKKIASMCLGVTKERMIKKYGEEEGLKRWKSYCDIHSYICSKQSYIDKYGVEEGLNKYYNDRAMTKELCIKRHGKEDGIKIWNNYCEQQRYTNSLEYYQEKYGKEEGKIKWQNNRKIFINAGLDSSANVISNISQELFNNIYKNIDKTDKIYFGNLNKEYEINNCGDNGSNFYRLDFYDKTKNIVIEFLGDYWHANPDIYKSNTTIKIHNKDILVNDIWDNDNKRKLNICKKLNNPIYLTVWENDYRKNPNEVINNLLKYFK